MHLILASQSLGRKKLLELTNIPFQIIPSTLDEDKIIGKTPLETIQLRAKLKGEEVLKKIQNPKSKFQIKSKIPSHKLTTNNQQLITILSADSGVIFDNQLIGKPGDYDDAVRIMQSLSGRTHELVTAVYIGIIETKPRVSILENDFSQNDEYAQNSQINWPTNIKSNIKVRSEKFDTEALSKRKIWQIYDRSLVTFKNLSLTTIKRYLRDSDYKRYAGGYALFDHPELIKPTLHDLMSDKSYKEILKPVNPHLHPRNLESLDLIASIEGSISNVIGLPLEKIIPILRKNILIKQI